MKESEIFECLKSKFGGQEYALLSQVANGTGGNIRRIADAIAVSLWPSRGIYLHGFEFKSSRQDFLNEMKNPEKAELIARFCKYWWLVVPKDLVKKSEIPDNWGLIYANDNGIGSGSEHDLNKRYSCRVVKQAIAKEFEQPTWHFIASMFRRAQAILPKDALFEQMKKNAYDNGVKDGKKVAESHMNFVEKNHKELLDKVKAFEKASGVIISDRWGIQDGAQIGKAVQSVLRGDQIVQRLMSQLQNLESSANNIKKNIEIELSNLSRKTT